MLNTKRNEIFNANDVISSNDLRKRIANIDSKFRATQTDSTTDFNYRFETPYKNVIRAKITSVEAPNSSYVFSAKNYLNTKFTVAARNTLNILQKAIIEIPNGNYTSSQLIITIQDLLNTFMLIPYGIYIEISINPQLNKTIIINRGNVVTSNDWPPPILTWDYIKTNYTILPPNQMYLEFSIEDPTGKTNPYGIGYNLGFRKKIYEINPNVVLPNVVLPNVVSIVSEACIDVVGNGYWFLAVDDFTSIQQQTTRNTFECLAKIVLKKPKGEVLFMDSRDLQANDIIFPSPIDITQIRIRLVDPFGNVVDLNNMDFSFSVEFTEVMNTKLYEFYRNYLWLGPIPSLQQDVRGTGVPLLGGRGP